MKAIGCKSGSDYIDTAIRFYNGYLHNKHNEEYVNINVVNTVQGITKTGCHPMRTKLDLFFNWGIELNTEYEVEKKEVRKVHYAGKDGLMLEIELREGRKAAEELTSKASRRGACGQNMTPVKDEKTDIPEDIDQDIS